MRLSWPDVSKDGRRKHQNFAAADIRFPSSKGYVYLQDGLPFLNTTIQDVTEQAVLLYGCASSITKNPSLDLLHDGSQNTLISYYEGILSRMITTVDDAENGFRAAVLPLALSSNDAAARGLLQSISSLAAVHLGRRAEALKYRLLAIKSLSASLQSSSTMPLAQLATCMMLCVNSVHAITPI